MSKFKKGDFVRAQDFSGASGRRLIRGKDYEVTGQNAKCLLLDHGSEGFHEDRFELGAALGDSKSG